MKLHDLSTPLEEIRVMSSDGKDVTTIARLMGDFKILYNYTCALQQLPVYVVDATYDQIVDSVYKYYIPLVLSYLQPILDIDDESDKEIVEEIYQLLNWLGGRHDATTNP